MSAETRRGAVTALAGLLALALPGAIASSDIADAALVDLGVLTQCDAQETICPDDGLEPREQIGIVATARGLVILRLAAFCGCCNDQRESSFEDADRHRHGDTRVVGHNACGRRLRLPRIQSRLWNPPDARLDFGARKGP
jgi:hypothetical protein